MELFRKVGGILPFLPHDKIIQFRNHSKTPVPLPDPYLLQTHLTLARILDASGLAKILEESFEEYYCTRQLAEDGSTNIAYMIEAS